MRGRRPQFALTVAFVVGVAATVAGLSAREAMAEPVTIDFLLPTGGSPIEGGKGYDTLNFTGQAVGDVAINGCGVSGSFPVQNGVLTPGPNSSGGATRLTGAIALVVGEVPPGTRLHPLLPVATGCSSGGHVYDRWRGTVVLP